MLHLSPPCFGIQALHVTPLAFLQRTFNIHFDETRNFLPCVVSHFSIWRDGGYEHMDPITGKELRDVGDSFNVLKPLLTAESR